MAFGRNLITASMVGMHVPVPPSIKVRALPHVKPTSVRALAIGTSSPEHTYIGTDIKDIRG